MAAFVAILVSTAFLAGIVWLIVRANRKVRAQAGAAGQMLTEISTLLAPQGKSGGYGTHTLRFAERDFAFSASPASRNSPALVRLSLPLDVRFAGAKAQHGAYRDTARRRVAGKLGASLRKETNIDRFGKTLRLNAEHDTQDAEFDRAVYIESDASHEDLDALLSDATTRTAVQQILGLGFTRIELFRGQASVQAVVVGPTPESIPKIPLVAERLAQIADNLPAFDNNPVGGTVALRTTLAAGLGILGAFASFVFAAVAAGSYQIIAPGAYGICVAIGLALWLVTSAVSFAVFRGKSDALRAFAFVFFSQLGGMPALAIGTAATLNAKLDTSPEMHHDAPIVRRWVTTSKNSKKIGRAHV